MKLIFVVLAIFLNVGSQLLIKYAMRATSAEGVVGLLRTFFTPFIILAVFFYGLSFLLTMKVFQIFPLAKIVPVMAASTFVLVAVSSTRLFGEVMCPMNWAGILFIICGIALLVAR